MKNWLVIDCTLMCKSSYAKAVALSRMSLQTATCISFHIRYKVNSIANGDFYLAEYARFPCVAEMSVGQQ